MSAVSTEISNVCFPKIDDRNDFSSDDSILSTVGRKPGVHNISPYENFDEVESFPPIQKDVDDYDVEGESVINVTDLELDIDNFKQGKRGTLKRMLKNLTRSNKYDLPTEDLQSNSETLETDTDNCQEKGPNGGKVTDKASKGSITSITKAFQRLSGVLSRTKIDQKESKDKSNAESIVEKCYSEKEKCNSLSRRISNMSAQLAKFGNQKAESTSLDDRSDTCSSSGNKQEPKANQLKRCPSEKSSSILSRRVSSLGSHFRLKGNSDPGSGEAVELAETKIGKDKLEVPEKKEIG